MLAKKLMGSAGGTAGGTAGDKLYADDVFSTYLYTGNGSTQTINNGIDLAGKGGMVWIKGRSGATDHQLFDTARTATYELISNSTAAQVADTDTLTAFNSTGFALGADATTNTNAATYASWTFRKAPKFFDVQTKSHTNGSASTVDLSALGTVGMVTVKATSTTSNWYTWHRSLTAGNNLKLNLTDVQSTTNAYLSVSGTTLTIASTAPTATYVVYAFAHDTSADGIIQCGSFTTDAGGNAPYCNLGYEPQFLILKNTTSSENWQIFDTQRGMPVGGYPQRIAPNLSAAESTNAFQTPIDATGFRVLSGLDGNRVYIYLAIRRPNKPPTSGTEVYNAIARTGAGGVNSTLTGLGFSPDCHLVSSRVGGQGNPVIVDRLRGAPKNLLLDDTTEGTSGIISFDMDGVTVGPNGYFNSARTYINHFFRRAPGFFDVVCYTGTGSATTVAHNLGVAPELMLVKGRNFDLPAWAVYPNDPTKYITISSTNGITSNYYHWNGAPTSSIINIGTHSYVNGNTNTYVAYLFATLPGISKVGSYTGNGSSQTVNCGFSTGARFILIKRTDSEGDWYVWDSARGIVAANDPHISLNTGAAEVTTDDSVDPDNSGFVCIQNAATNINVTNATYIYLAIS